MATPSDHLSRSEASIPDRADNTEPNSPATPPMPHQRGDTYYNFPTQAASTKPELNSSTTNIDMQPNPMYQDFPPGVTPRPASQKQIVVEKIKEGNPDALSSSATLVNNVKIYERLESLIPGFSLSPRYSYSPQKETARDSTYQYLGTIRGDTNEPLEGLPVSRYNSVTRVSLQALFSVLLVLSLFTAVIALVIAILSVSVANSQLTASREISRKLEELTPLIDANSTYKAIVQNITDTQQQLDSLRRETADAISVLTSANNCTVRTIQCLVENLEKNCRTVPMSVSSVERLTGMACAATNENGEARIIFDELTSEYSCYCEIAIAQSDKWSCNLSLWVCQVV